MNEIKYQITQFIFLVLLGLGAYWALTHLDTGVRYSRDHVVENINEAQETTPDQVVNAVNNETILSASTNETTDTSDETTTQPVTETTSKHADLIADLQKLVDANTMMNSGANGTNVAVVQKFLDVYFADITVGIDSDFGPTTKKLVTDFQSKELNGGDGRVGPNTLRAMIKYLEK